jgi:hypothetical protein
MPEHPLGAIASTSPCCPATLVLRKTKGLVGPRGSAAPRASVHSVSFYRDSFDRARRSRREHLPAPEPIAAAPRVAWYWRHPTDFWPAKYLHRSLHPADTPIPGHASRRRWCRSQMKRLNSVVLRGHWRRPQLTLKGRLQPMSPLATCRTVLWYREHRVARVCSAIPSWCFSFQKCRICISGARHRAASDQVAGTECPLRDFWHAAVGAACDDRRAPQSWRPPRGWLLIRPAHMWPFGLHTCGPHQLGARAT